MSKFCTNCGAELEPGVKFCTSCGQKVAQEAFLNLGDGLHKLFHDRNADKGAILEQLFFTFKGRLNRQSYIFRGLFLGLVNLIVDALISWPVNVNDPGALDYMLIFVSIGINVTFFVGSLAIAARRLHDLDTSGWWLLLSLVPVVNIGFGIYILFMKGTQGPNKYGADPLQQ